MEDPKQIEDDSIVGTDTQGNELTHYVIAERLVALDCTIIIDCLLYTSPSPRDVEESRMPSSA